MPPGMSQMPCASMTCDALFSGEVGDLWGRPWGYGGLSWEGVGSRGMDGVQLSGWAEPPRMEQEML